LQTRTEKKCHGVNALYLRAFNPTIVGIPPREDFYIGDGSVKLFLPIFKMNFPEIVDIALLAQGVFHNLVFVSIRKTYPMQAYKIMHGLRAWTR
jgi:4-hydroxy-3-polyprenylbenzoate decarboxylase